MMVLSAPMYKASIMSWGGLKDKKWTFLKFLYLKEWIFFFNYFTLFLQAWFEVHTHFKEGKKEDRSHK